MAEKLTTDMIRRAAALAQSQHVTPRTVKTKREAAMLTRADPAGHKWQVGDQYYLAVANPGGTDNGNH